MVLSNEAFLALQIQIEFYFAPQNFSRDVYLKSHMNDDRYVPISLIATFPKVLSFTNDISVITKAMKESPYIEVNEEGTMVRTKLIPRTTVIIRNVPDNTSSEEITQLALTVIEKSNIVSVTKDMDLWYVDFSDEPTTIKMAEALHGTTFNNNIISVGVKSVTHTRPSTYIPEFAYTEKKRNVNNKQNRKPKKPYTRDFPVLGSNGKDTITPLVSNISSTSGYSSTFIKYTREEMAAVLEKMNTYKFSKPDTYVQFSKLLNDSPIVPIIRDIPNLEYTLLEPIPLMYPASPSPVAMAAPTSGLPPLLDLNAPLPSLDSLNLNSTTVLPLLDGMTLNSLDNMGSIPFVQSTSISNKAKNEKKDKNQKNYRQMKPTNNNNRNNNNNRAFKKGSDLLAFPTTHMTIKPNNPVKTMNFASIVANQPSEELVKKAQLVAQANLVARQSKNENKNDETEVKKEKNEVKSEKETIKNDQNNKKKNKKTPLLTSMNPPLSANNTPSTGPRWSDLVK